MSTPAQSLVAADPREQKRREIKIAAPYRHHFAWRVVAETAWAFGLWVAMIGLALQGIIPYAVACLVNGWLAYLMYMTLHEATHGNVSGGNAQLRWVDDLIGSISSIPLWFSYRSHRLSHMQHHAHTNDPTLDPDHFVGGPFSALIPKYLTLSFLEIAIPVLSLVPGGMRVLPRSLQSLAAEDVPRSALEIAYQRRFILTCLAVFLALTLAGYFKAAFLLWYLPAKLGVFVVFAVFAWLPHLPHEERGRYRDTRITLFRGGTLLLRGQNHHLLHHMFPRVPHYGLPALFADLRPILEAQGARIEGPLAGPGAAKIGLRWDPDAR